MLLLLLIEGIWQPWLTGCQRCLWESHDCVFSWTLLNNDGASWNNCKAPSGETQQCRVFEALRWDVLDLREILEGLGTNGRAELGSVQQSHRIRLMGPDLIDLPQVSICFCCTILQLSPCSVWFLLYFISTDSVGHSSAENNFISTIFWHLKLVLSLINSLWWEYISPTPANNRKGTFISKQWQSKGRIYLPNRICLLPCIGT